MNTNIIQTTILAIALLTTSTLASSNYTAEFKHPVSHILPAKVANIRKPRKPRESRKPRISRQQSRTLLLVAISK